MTQSGAQQAETDAPEGAASDTQVGNVPDNLHTAAYDSTRTPLTAVKPEPAFLSMSDAFAPMTDARRAGTLNQPGDRVADSVPKEDATGRMKDIIEGKPVEPVGDARGDYNRSLALALTRSGMSPDKAAERAAEITRTTLERLQAQAGKLGPDGKPLLDGTPEQQMARMARAMDSILNPDTASALNRMSPQMRQNMVVDLAQRMSDPEKYGNQGAHMTCALQSIQKQALMSKDPARMAEMLAGVVNNGFAQLSEIDPKTGKPRIVEVDSRSLTPDAESRMNPANFGGRDVRGMAGHTMDALFGQLVADKKGEAENSPKKYVYLASGANDIQGGQFRGRSDTGEGLFERNGSNLTKFVDGSPVMTLVDKARLSNALGLPERSLFIHKSMAGELQNLPPEIQKQFFVFENADQLKAGLRDLQTRGGVGEIRVNAPFLPGGGMSGHGLHSVNIRMGDDGQLIMDNNWGTDKDQVISSDALMLATNAERWGNTKFRPEGPNPARPGDPGFGKPTVWTPDGPGTGRNPNEDPQAYQKRINQLQQDRDQEIKNKIEALQKELKIQPDLQKELTELVQERTALQRANADFQKAYKTWLVTKSGDEPSLTDYLERYRLR